MTLLDDYQAQHKLEGVRIVSFMLHGIPKEILRRTGVDELIFTVAILFFAFLLVLTFVSCSVAQNMPLPSFRPRNPNAPSVDDFDLAQTYSQSRRGQVFRVL